MLRSIYKVPLLGDFVTGKTSLRQNFMGTNFSQSYMKGLGTDFASHSQIFNDEMLTFQIWDLAPFNIFTNSRDQFITGSSGGIIVFDHSNPFSFKNIENYIQELWKCNGIIPLIILGNKTDIELNGEMTDDVLEYIDELNSNIDNKDIRINYFETSVATGKNVLNSFENLFLEIRKAS